MISYNIIPKPNYYKHGDSTYTVSPKTKIVAFEGFVRAASYISSYLKTETNANEGIIKFQKTDNLEKEAYELKITNDGIIINASDIAGALYGAVTLRTILMQSKKENGKAVLQTLIIIDAPDNKYRGVMLDCSRHYFEKQDILNLLDNMLFLKLNSLHWHLSDDQGFRIESEEFPLLNTVGSKRKSRHLKGYGLENDNVEEARYYTKAEIKEIVEYAQNRNIQIIPEIDLPGHTMDILASYPELSCDSKPREVMTINGISDAIICAGKKESFEFLEKLFDEICPLFPGEYFHIGGDEAFEGYKVWEKCECCKQKMNELGINKAKDLQVYFMNELLKILKKNRKKAIAWDDCVDDGLDSEIVCQFWRPNVIAKVKRQSKIRDVIISPTSHFYFDYKFSVLPLKKTYNFSKYKAGFFDDTQRALGMECEIWTEFIDSTDSLEFTLYPRLNAFSEVCWTEFKNRSFKDFLLRLEWYKTYMRKKNINFSRIIKGCSLNKACAYHLGEDGKEFKKSMELKNEEN